MDFKIFVLLLFISLQKAFGSVSNDTLFLSNEDTIFLHSNLYLEKYFLYELKPAQTLYSVARFYGLHLNDLYYYNIGLRDSNTGAGSKVKIPVPNRAITRYKTSDFNLDEFIPVYYVVKKGDTMFRIAKSLFRMELEEIRVRNNLPSNTIHVGQVLHVGWMSKYGIPDSFRKSTNGPLDRRNEAMKTVYNNQMSYKNELTEQGVAYWNKTSKEDSDFYALHDTAPLNSVIAINNPMSRRTLYAKVVGRIPLENYGPNIKVIVSPLAAKFLGAVDPRFFVKIRYLR